MMFNDIFYLSKSLFKVSFKCNLCRYNQIRHLISVNGEWTKIYDDCSQIPSLLKQIESQWKVIIENYWDNVLRENEKKKVSRYVLSMFPYPSGALHLGHIRVYTTSDMLSKMSHLRGHTIVHSMGFDSFGLPAENAALQNSINPREWTHFNTMQMLRQLKSIGYHFNWRESTSDPSYYKWTQWLFLQLYHSNLVYRGMGFVNWDPIDCTVLADEQVNENGVSWRSGAVVEKRYHRQWFVKTNSLAHDLFLGNDVQLNGVGNWDEVILQQRHWIGKPNGYIFYLKLENSDDILQIFTKFPELFANEKAFIAVSDRHWLSKSDKMPKIINPFTNLMMDIRVVNNDSIPMSTEATITVMRESFEDPLVRNDILNKSKELKIGGYFTSDKYRDWLISRQRYWGTPIPIVYCDRCGVQPIPEDQLPVQLPHLSDWDALQHFKSQDISNPIKKLAPKEWLYTDCPKCGFSGAMRETETCDTFFDSSWYFLRFASKPSDSEPFNKSLVNTAWCYTGGLEHSAVHLFYARFITHFLYAHGLCPFREPFGNLLMQRMVKAKTYKVNGHYIKPEDVSKYKDVEVKYEKMSKSKGNGVDPDILIEKYGCDALRWCILQEGSPRTEKLWKTDDEEFGPTLNFFRRVLITIEEFLEAKQQEKAGIIGKKVKDQVKISVLSQQKKSEAIKDLCDTRSYSIYQMLFHMEFSYLTSKGIMGIYVLLSALRRYARSDVSLTPEYERLLAELIIMTLPLTPHFAAECWSSFVTEAVGDSRYYDISKSVMEQKWPKLDDSFPLHIYLIDYKGKHNMENARFTIDRASIIQWSEEEIRNLIDIPSEDIHKIHIHRDVCIVIQLKDNVQMILDNDTKFSNLRRGT